MKPLSSLCFSLGVLSLASFPVQAEKAGNIIIGASLPLSGINAASGQEGLSVMKAYFDSVNKAGGIEGRMLQLETLDDQSDPAKTAGNAQSLIDKKAVVLFNCWGTSSCNAMLPVAIQAGVPLVGGIAGGGLMRQQQRFAFNVRASTQAEIARMMKQMVTVGQSNIALVFQNDSFGESGQAAAHQAFKKYNIKPAAELRIDPDSGNAATVIDTLKKLPRLNGIILVASPAATISLISQSRKTGLETQFYNLSAQASNMVIQGLGKYTSGVVFTTLAPNPWKDGIPIVNEYQTIYRASTGRQDYSYLGMEVFINARVLADGLRNSIRGSSNASLVSALDTMGLKNYGPLSVNFAPDHHEGSSYVGIAIINSRGQFVE
ncbi:MAG: ABC transporter substrate-binding protein [Pseudomonadota bacterium]|nr:ABC transporter substrate-binding protein [Pseudomonadota bacterium]